MMNVGDLKLLLEGLDDGVEVRIAHQPSYPFEYSITELAMIEGVEIEKDGIIHAKPSILYVLEGDQIGHISEEIIESIGW